MGLQEVYAQNTAMRAAANNMRTASAARDNSMMLGALVKTIALRSEAKLENRKLDLQADQLELDEKYKSLNYEILQDKLANDKDEFTRVEGRLKKTSEDKLQFEKDDAKYKDLKEKRFRRKELRRLEQLHELALKKEGELSATETLANKQERLDSAKAAFSLGMVDNWKAQPESVRNQFYQLFLMAKTAERIGGETGNDIANQYKSLMKNHSLEVQAHLSPDDIASAVGREIRTGEFDFGDNTGLYQYRTVGVEQSDGSVKPMLYYQKFDGKDIEGTDKPVFGKVSMSGLTFWETLQNPNNDAVSKRMALDLAAQIPGVSHKEQMVILNNIQQHIRDSVGTVKMEDDDQFTENKFETMRQVMSTLYGPKLPKGIDQGLYTVGLNINITGHPTPHGMGLDGLQGSFNDDPYRNGPPGMGLQTPTDAATPDAATPDVATPDAGTPATGTPAVDIQINPVDEATSDAKPVAKPVATGEFTPNQDYTPMPWKHKMTFEARFKHQYGSNQESSGRSYGSLPASGHRPRTVGMKEEDRRYASLLEEEGISPELSYMEEINKNTDQFRYAPGGTKRNELPEYWQAHQSNWYSGGSKDVMKGMERNLSRIFSFYKNQAEVFMQDMPKGQRSDKILNQQRDIAMQGLQEALIAKANYLEGEINYKFPPGTVGYDPVLLQRELEETQQLLKAFPGIQKLLRSNYTVNPQRPESNLNKRWNWDENTHGEETAIGMIDGNAYIPGFIMNIYDMDSPAYGLHRMFNWNARREEVDYFKNAKPGPMAGPGTFKNRRKEENLQRYGRSPDGENVTFRGKSSKIFHGPIPSEVGQ